MNRFDRIVDFIDRHKYGILVTLVVHVGLFLYFQIATCQEGVLFEPWDFRTNETEAPDDIQITADQIETESERDLFEPKEVSSFVKNENDNRERRNDPGQLYTSYSDNQNAEQLEDDYEKSIKEQLEKERAEKEKNQPKSNADVQSDKDKKKETKSFDFGPQASTTAVSGETMVSYNLKDRHPLNNNDWYVRNPGYTCGSVNGTVKVAITVDEGGKVIAANLIDSGSQNATPCMKQKSVEYALKSRFNYASNAPQKQEGVITYRFVYRN